MLSKILFFSICLISLFAVIVQADTAEDNPGKCWNPIEGKAYNPGESWPSNGGGCMKFTCMEDGSIGAVTCPLIHCGSGCGHHLTEQDDSKPYPLCCPQVVKD